MNAKQFLIALLLLCPVFLLASDRDSTIRYELPDSVKAYQFLGEITVNGFTPGREVEAGIRTDQVSVYLEANKKGRSIVFEFPKSALVVANGIQTTRPEKGELSFAYNWTSGVTYRLLIAAAADSAENFCLLSGYAWLAGENKWKLLGTCRVEGRRELIREPAAYADAARKTSLSVTHGNAWCQRTNNSWKQLGSTTAAPPLLNFYGHADSVEQRAVEKSLIDKSLAEGKRDERNEIQGVHYIILKEGTGQQVNVTDTVTVNYRLTLFSDGSFVDGTSDKPATFPLNRLIRGWQIGVPLLKTGGKIRLVIPSDLGYSIRTRSAKIPPNSILVFEVEVLGAKQ